MSSKAASERGQRDGGSFTECPMSKILIAFYSRNGSTEALAKAVAEGAQAAGAEVGLRRARELVSEEVMKAAPGWLDNARRMTAAYEAPTTADAERDRKSVVEGKSVSVRVALGGRRTINKKKI